MRYSLKYARFSGLLFAIAIIIIDQYTKRFFLEAATTTTYPLEILPFFNINLVFNRGISFGMFAQGAHWLPRALILGTAFIVLMLFIWLMRARERSVVCSLGIIIGGALGNIIDRAHYGYVIDFLDFHLGAYHWPAFNMADTAVFIGVVILILMGIVKPNTAL